MESGQEAQRGSRETVRLPLLPLGPEGEVAETRVVAMEEGVQFVPLLSSLEQRPVGCEFAIIYLTSLQMGTGVVSSLLPSQTVLTTNTLAHVSRKNV